MKCAVVTCEVRLAKMTTAAVVLDHAPGLTLRLDVCRAHAVALAAELEQWPRWWVTGLPGLPSGEELPPTPGGDITRGES